MTVLILAQGRSNKGKTTALRMALGRLGIRLPDKPRDFRIFLAHYRKAAETKNLSVALASPGDNLAAMRKNIEFLREHKPEYMIVACRTEGQPLDVLLAFAGELGAETRKVLFPGPVGDAYIEDRAEAILRELP